MHFIVKMQTSRSRPPRSGCRSYWSGSPAKKNRNACQIVRAEIDRNIGVTKSAAWLALCVACVEDRPRQERLECN